MDKPTASLVYIDEKGAGRQYHIEGEAFIGRDHDCHIQIFDVSISRKHARISFDTGSGCFRVEDVGSRNGSAVNGQRICAPTPIHSNDLLRLGDQILLFCPDFEILPDAGSERTVLFHDGMPTVPQSPPTPCGPDSGPFALPPDLFSELLLALSAESPLEGLFGALGRRLPFDSAVVLAARPGESPEALWSHGALRSIPVSRRLAERVIDERVGLRQEDFSTRGLLRTPLSPLISVLTEPACLGGEVHGLVLLNREASGFEPDQASLLKAACPMVAAAIVLERRRLRARKRPPPPAPGELVGASRAMVELKKTIDTVAPATTAVLISGESGTGKELVARRLHALGPNPAGPFMAFNCGAITETLANDDLFGHTKGSFTGAGTAREGKLEAADGGTLFLDEVGELSPQCQALLLRALDQKTIYRIGSCSPIVSKFRLVAATHRDLRAMCAEGKFREDLFQRLDVFRIAIPPLRDRPEDIKPLVERFVDQFANELGKEITGVDLHTLEILQAYPWPGNVRELRNVVERMVVLAGSKVLNLNDLPEDLRPVLPPDRLPDGAGMNLREQTAQMEERLIKQALKFTQGNLTAAARLLGIGRTRLKRKIKAYKLGSKENQGK